MTLVSALKPAGSKRPWGVAYNFVFEGAELQRSVMTCPGSHRARTRSLVQCLSNFMCLSNLRLNSHKLVHPALSPISLLQWQWVYDELIFLFYQMMFSGDSRIGEFGQSQDLVRRQVLNQYRLSPRLCISYKLQDDADAVAGPWTTLEQ